MCEFQKDLVQYASDRRKRGYIETHIGMPFRLFSIYSVPTHL